MVWLYKRPDNVPYHNLTCVSRETPPALTSRYFLGSYDFICVKSPAAGSTVVLDTSSCWILYLFLLPFFFFVLVVSGSACCADVEACGGSLSWAASLSSPACSPSPASSLAAACASEIFFFFFSFFSSALVLQTIQGSYRQVHVNSRTFQGLLNDFPTVFKG